MKEKDSHKSLQPNFARPSSNGVRNGKTNDGKEINYNAIKCTFDSPEKFVDIVNFVSPSELPSCSAQKDVTSASRNRCEYCNEADDTIICCSDPLPNALKEDEVLNYLKTSYYNGTPCLKLDNFRVYDDLRHLCAFDGNLLDNATCLYFSGLIKPFDCDASSSSDGYPCEDIGPIEEWWLQEDDDNSTKIGISSANAYYYLEKPMPEYIPFIKSLNEKVFLKKTIIDILQTESHELDYEGLLNILSSITYDGTFSFITEDVLLRNGSFICRQVQLFDNDADDDAKIISTTACVETLARKINYNFNDIIESNNSDDSVNEDSEDNEDFDDVIEDIQRSRPKKPAFKNKLIIGQRKYECIVTTPLVKDVFMEYLTNNITSEPNTSKESRVEAPNCSDRNERSITRNLSAIVVKRLTQEEIKFYLTNKVADYKESEDPSPCESNLIVNVPVAREFKTILLKSLSDDVVNFYLHKYSESSERSKYVKLESENENNGSAAQSDCEISIGNFVSVINSSSIARVQRMYESGKKKKYFHAQWFIRSLDTIISGHPNELFETNQCEDVLLKNCCQVVSVEFVPIQPDWSDRGNLEYIEKLGRNDDPTCHFYYQKKFCVETARFEDVRVEPESPSASVNCYNCDQKKTWESLETPFLIQDSTFEERNMVQWRNEQYRVGSCVFLNPNTIMERQPREKDDSDSDEEDYDEELFPEKYRKKFTRSPRDLACDPFDIGYICKIWTEKRCVRQPSDILLDVKKFYRPENTNLSRDCSRRMDLNLLYWSDESSTVDFSNVQGKCSVSYKDNLSCSVNEWAKKGPYRFYFSQSYNKESGSITPSPPCAMKIGRIEGMDVENDQDVPPDYPPVAHLRSFDVFCGCGGLTYGLEEANVAKCQWAVDKDVSSSRAFKLNFPEAIVYNEDANNVLKAILEEKTTYHGQTLPQKGEVDILCGGPPCQGFSLLNRFPTGAISKFYNSLVATYLSYCDHFKPRFFVLENVRHFVKHKSKVFKLTVNCLVRMGYQVAFFVLQSGRFGIPQSRSRVIIIAAAPGEVLPTQPESLHTLAAGATFETTVDDMKYSSAVWKTSAPYRMIDVFDAISDLPPVEGHERPFTVKPITHYQRGLRIRNGVEETILKDHISFPSTPIIEKRISFISKNSYCDWRDLPNIAVKLRDGTLTKKLKYTHGPKSAKGAFRGVCSCSINAGKCNKKYRQTQTLIPWCLSHTANRNTQWAGCYARLRFDSIFRTINASVNSSINRNVLHPVENRIVSVREYGRSVGFPDGFQFHGSFRDKYRQIGNCVAPPLAKAIGMEIRKAVQKLSDTDSSS